MKKLDHNEAVKALREGKVVVAWDTGSGKIKYKIVSGSFNFWDSTSEKWLLATGDSFIHAEYFTLEEPEEQKEKSLSEIVYNELPWPTVSDHISHIGLRNILGYLADELDKRYVRK